MLPDSYAGWIRPALREGRRILAAGGIELVYSSAPPDSAHRVAGRLAGGAGLPWIADCRDPWFNLHLKTPPTPLHRLLLSYGASLYTRLITGLPLKDPTGGFKCFKRQVLEAIDLDRVHSNGYSFQIEMSFRAWQKGFKLKEISIIFVDRVGGKSKMSSKIVREAIWMVWILKIKQLFGIL